MTLQNTTRVFFAKYRNNFCCFVCYLELGRHIFLLPLLHFFFPWRARRQLRKMNSHCYVVRRPSLLLLDTGSLFVLCGTHKMGGEHSARQCCSPSVGRSAQVVRPLDSVERLNEKRFCLWRESEVRLLLLRTFARSLSFVRSRSGFVRSFVRPSAASTFAKIAPRTTSLTYSKRAKTTSNVATTNPIRCLSSGKRQLKPFAAGYLQFKQMHPSQMFLRHILHALLMYSK